jgi:Ca-activated chloride channel homolog
VVALGTRYGIVTPYTSFLAVEPGAEPQRAVDVQGYSAPDRNGPPPPAPPPPPPPPSAPIALESVVATGAGAVRQAKRDRAQQDAVSVADSSAAPGDVRRVGDKTFYLRTGWWSDAEVTASTQLPVTEVETGSDAYFDLLRREPRLARYFALGERVQVLLDGRIYRAKPPASPAPKP